MKQIVSFFVLSTVHIIGLEGYAGDLSKSLTKDEKNILAKNNCRKLEFPSLLAGLRDSQILADIVKTEPGNWKQAALANEKKRRLLVRLPDKQVVNEPIQLPDIGGPRTIDIDDASDLLTDTARTDCIMPLFFYRYSTGNEEKAMAFVVDMRTTQKAAIKAAIYTQSTSKTWTLKTNFQTLEGLELQKNIGPRFRSVLKLGAKKFGLHFDTKETSPLIGPLIGSTIIVSEINEKPQVIFSLGGKENGYEFYDGVATIYESKLVLDKKQFNGWNEIKVVTRFYQHSKKETVRNFKFKNGRYDIYQP